jgi:hypothetical protein
VLRDNTRGTQVREEPPLNPCWRYRALHLFVLGRGKTSKIFNQDLFSAALMTSALRRYRLHSIHGRPEYVLLYARTHLQVHHGSPLQVRTRSPL